MKNFTQEVMAWYAENGRELPWRGCDDPYAIWLSEIILQQTRIQQGQTYWERFVKRWPTVESLAAATEDEVLREWQGLGYYSRARNLHYAARQIVDLGHFPNTYREIRQLKGVGDYTAAAVGSMAFALPVAAVDGNVYRVLARHFGVETPINSAQGKKVFHALAQSLLPKGQPAIFNQAMMDFGALQCTPQSPRCVQCPLQDTCDALHTGRVRELPVKQKKIRVKTVSLSYVYVRFHGETAIRRRGHGDIWEGLWEPLLLSNQSLENSHASVMDVSTDNIEQTLSLRIQREGVLLRRNVRHVLTHRVLLADFYLWEPVCRPCLPESYQWIQEKNVDSYAVPRLIEKLLELVRG